MLSEEPEQQQQLRRHLSPLAPYLAFYTIVTRLSSGFVAAMRPVQMKEVGDEPYIN